MAQPSYIGSGVTPRPNDTRLMRWTKILGKYQNLAASPKAANNPSKNDTLRRIKLKLLRALNGV